LLVCDIMLRIDWICQQIPDAPKSPLGGRPSADKRKVVAGIFWMLDNGAKWKDLPRRFGRRGSSRSKRT